MVSDVYTHSDYPAIIFEFWERSTERHVPAAPLNLLWKNSTFDRETFVLTLEDIQLFGNANDKAMKLMHSITEVYNTSMARRGHLSGRKHDYWWNTDIVDLRRECNRARRLFQRARGSDNFSKLRERCSRRGLVSSVSAY